MLEALVLWVLLKTNTKQRDIKPRRFVVIIHLSFTTPGQSAGIIFH